MTEDAIKLIVGLGNPGRAYAGNRHNAGFMCLNYFARQHGIRFDKKQGQARTGAGEVAGTRVVAARPQTYMNRSGEAVSRLTEKLNIRPDNLLVIHDDLDLPLGKIRIRRSGSSGGHKGIESITACLDSRGYPRIRIGIGRPAGEDTAETSESDIIDYVLSGFTPGEKPVLNQVIPVASEAILCILTEGVTAAMNRYNQTVAGAK
ncbi:aminoacyl-tRNA hydrolase [Chloroflexota bacterium]